MGRRVSSVGRNKPTQFRYPFQVTLLPELRRALFRPTLFTLPAPLMICCVVVCFMIPGSIAAQTKKAGKPVVEKSAREKAFERLDRDSDKKISAEEYFDGSVGKAAENKRIEHNEWDLDGNGALDFDEFKKRGNKQPDQDQLKKDFARRDKDSDGRVTYEEFLGDREGEQKTEARSAFFRFDANENGAISEEEFVKRDVKKLSAGNQFRQLDTDEDKQLSEDEFMRPKLGSQWEQAGRDNFKKFDLNGDQTLNEREFAITPALKPDPETMFRGLDTDESGELNAEELTVLLPKQQQVNARRSFSEYDLDGSGGLGLDEYLDREASLAWKKTKRSLANWGNTWGIALLIIADLVIAGIIGRIIYRRFWARSSPEPAATATTTPPE